MDAFLEQWSYLGIFVWLIATGLGLPMPEEVPVVAGGALVGGRDDIHAFIMLPVCIAGVLVGDMALYMIGRIWGAKLVEKPFVQRRLLPPQRLASIRENFQKYGIKILLFARLTPGIRAPIFITAGISHLSWIRFLVADAIYALPGVSLLFLLGYLCADHIKTLTEQIERVKSWLILVVVAGVSLYFCYRFLRRPVVTGSPQEMPPIMEPVSNTIDSMTGQILHPEKKSEPATKDPVKSDEGAREPAASSAGRIES